MKIYFDACCLNRLTDDQTQPRIRHEADAVEAIFRHIRDRSIEWISSAALIYEIESNPDVEKRAQNATLLNFVSGSLEVDSTVVTRARDLQGAGYGAYDALHLAFAEAGQTDVLLTTDDAFIRKATRRDGNPRVAVANPLSWSKEHLQ